MIHALHDDALTITDAAINAVKPDMAVQRALQGLKVPGRLFLVAVGKAAWQMASAALTKLTVPVSGGIVLTKYGHVPAPLPGLTCIEAGHPVPDVNSYRGTKAVLDLTAGLTAEDTVLFLVSGGGSALFELPLVTPEELEQITAALLAGGASIHEINTIRKRLSAVKGGRFAAHCSPAQVYSVVLSDVLGDRLDVIASGPAAPDTTTSTDALQIADAYKLKLSDKALECLHSETCKETQNVTSTVIGSVRELCSAAASVAEKLGYETVFLTDRLCCEAKEAGSFLGAIAQCQTGNGKKRAYLAGGETVVHLTGNGLGGRNQELALAAAPLLSGLNAALFSVGSDGTDGPTDAAGGYCDGDTLAELNRLGLSPTEILANNDSYHALQQIGGLIVTGPTGTNVNDFCCLLISG